MKYRDLIESRRKLKTMIFKVFIHFDCSMLNFNSVIIKLYSLAKMSQNDRVPFRTRSKIDSSCSVEVVQYIVVNCLQILPNFVFQFLCGHGGIMEH